MNLKGHIAAKARAFTVGRFMLDEFPMKCLFHDQNYYEVPRSIWKEWRFWRTACISELTGVYDAYQGGDVIDVGAFHGIYSLC